MQPPAIGYGLRYECGIFEEAASRQLLDGERAGQFLRHDNVLQLDVVG
jgi:glucan phosphorylase